MKVDTRKLLGLAAAACMGVSWVGSVARAGNAANLEVPLDSSFDIVTFNGTAEGRNDDAFISLQSLTGSVLPFDFNLYGSQRTDLFINNNGNVSFGQGFSTYTASGFPIANVPMVAAFWADVDTRNAASGLVHYKLYDSNGGSDINTLTVIWDNVGYFSNQIDKTNTFELTISDGTNADMGIGQNVCFSYDDMQWTTGSASGGSSGFGGTAATVGVNKGDGSSFFQIGRFDHAGDDYDGSGGTTDGVSYLDNQDICFSASEAGANQAPVAINFPSGGALTLDPTAGDTLNLLLSFIGPELGDAVSLTSVTDPSGAQLAGLSVVLNDGDPATAQLNWTPGVSLLGNSYVLTFNFEDSFGLTSSRSLTINIDDGGGPPPPPPGVPLPAAAWMGLVTLAGLGGTKLARRLKA